MGELGGTISWRELLADATDRLDAAGCERPALDARRIVEECSRTQGAALSLALDEPATRRGVARFDELVARRAAGEPIQYVLGHWAFRSLDLMVDERVLIPRPETEVVVDVALAELDRLGGDRRPTTVVDLGTGSGAIALSLAVERVQTAVWATDASGAALQVAAANLAGVGRAGARVRLAEGSWFDALPKDLAGSVDVIVSNPPYVADDAELPAEVDAWEPHAALFAGADGTDDLVRIIEGAVDWLAEPGSLVVELSPEQASAMADLAASRYRAVELAPDLTGRTRALVARR